MSTVLICCDKFKGSATSAEVSEALATGLTRAGHDVAVSPLADGGDGTLEAFDSLGYRRIPTHARGSDGHVIATEYGMKNSTAVIEIARVCGLDQASSDGQTPASDAARQASSCGVGDLIIDAVDHGASRVIIGLGGSATTDAGFGMAQALGVEFFDAKSSPVSHVRDMGSVARASLVRIDPRLASVEFVIASDVRNPLTGSNGAATVYGPQKGLNSAGVQKIDQAIDHFAQVVEETTGLPGIAQRPGAGAAGGLGFMAAALLSATMYSGVDLILDETGGETLLDRADLVITGEGRIDAQTLSGKAPAGIAERARSRGIPVVAVCGQNQLEGASASSLFEAIYSLAEYESDVHECIRNPLPILENIGRDIAEHHFA